MAIFSIVIPARNEVTLIPNLSRACSKLEHLFATHEHLSDHSIEFVFVDNASDDGTWEELVKVFGTASSVKLIQHTVNMGLQNSIMTGLINAGGDAVIVLQSDLQDPPEIVIEMAELWLSGNKYVTTQINKRNSGFIDRHSRNLGYLILNLAAGVNVLKNSGDFWLIDRSIVNKIKIQDFRRPFFRTLLPKIQPVDYIIKYDRMPRTVGKSNFDFLGKYEFFLDAIFSDPRRMMMLMSVGALVGMTLFGTLFVVAGILVYVPSHFVAISTLRTVAILGVILFCISGVVLGIGLILEMLWRIYSDFTETRARVTGIWDRRKSID
jgi:glycosyltransferase involved in cell wall biosynthesis